MGVIQVQGIGCYEPKVNVTTLPLQGESELATTVPVKTPFIQDKLKVPENGSVND